MVSFTDDNNTTRFNYKITTKEIRKLICSKFDSGKPQVDIANELQIPYNTVISIIRKYKRTGSFESSKKKCGRMKKLKIEDELYIKEVINSDVSTTLKKIKELVLENKGKSVAIGTLHIFYEILNIVLNE